MALRETPNTRQATSQYLRNIGDGLIALLENLALNIGSHASTRKPPGSEEGGRRRRAILCVEREVWREE